MVPGVTDSAGPAVGINSVARAGIRNAILLVFSTFLRGRYQHGANRIKKSAGLTRFSMNNEVRSAVAGS